MPYIISGLLITAILTGLWIFADDAIDSYKVRAYFIGAFCGAVQTALTGYGIAKIFNIF